MAAHGRRISSLSVTYQEEYHRPHSARKHTTVKHHPFAKPASGSDRVSNPNQNYPQLAKAPSKTVPQFNPVKTAASNPSSCLAVPVPQLPEDRILEDVCGEFGEELTGILQDQKDNAAALYSPISCFHPPLPQSLSINATPILPPVQCNTTPSSSATHQSQQTLHPYLMYDGSEQIGATHGRMLLAPSSGATNPTCTHHSIDTVTMPGSTPQSMQTASTSTAAIVPPCSVPWTPSVYQLYGLEDQLRHKINVEIENFRMLVQQTLYEQFHQYQVTYPQHPATYEQVDQHSPHNKTISQFGGSVDSQNRYGKTSTDLIQQADQEEIEQSELLDGHQEILEGSSTCSSVYSSGEISITSDSGVELCTHEAPSTVEQQIDSCLIQLQTYSLGMTNILSKRAEYNVL